MTTTFKAASALFAAALVVTSLASCGEKPISSNRSDANQTAAADISAGPNLLFPDNFKGVCSGASVSSATAYDAAAKAHKALYFATYKDDFVDQSSSLPGDWTVQFAADHDALKAIDVVVCAKRTAAQEVKVCDGFKNKDKPTQNKVRWHTATYDLSVREAKTGKILAQKTVEASDSDCPMFMMFNGDTETVDGYASLPGTAVVDFLKPHVAR